MRRQPGGPCPTRVSSPVSERGEHDTGDIRIVDDVTITTTVINQKKPQYQERGVEHTQTNGRIIKSGKHEKPGWNTVEVIVEGDRGTHIVNGRVNNRLWNIQQPDPQPPRAFAAIDPRPHCAAGGGGPKSSTATSKSNRFASVSMRKPAGSEGPGGLGWRSSCLAFLGAFLLVLSSWAQGSPPADQLPLKPDMPCSAVVEPSSLQVKLTPEQEKRAMAVYKRAIVMTAHDHCFHPDDFRDQEQGGITVRTIKLTTDGIYWEGAKRFEIFSPVAGWEERGRKAIRILKDVVAASKGKVLIVRRVEDILRAKRENKLGVIVSFEGGRPLAGRVENLQKFYDLGLREMQTFWAVPSPLKTPDKTYTDFGLQVIREMNRLGIVVDLSHHTEEAFSQALAATRHPVLISHCAVKAVSRAESGGTDHLEDETVRALARNGGVICLHFYHGYIRSQPGRSRSTVEELVDHMDYIKKLVGIGYVALGVDYFPERAGPWVLGAEQMREMPNVAREMVRRGYTNEEIEKVLGRNLMRVYRQVWKH